ncbi:Sec-independent protein translocase protein TatB [Methylobacterium planeticum]|uniref:Sec-independent protein translocase protein TatB n=1 Tax=Methylobacterium planeticum TaxID=2615211 RepID=A0A6N6MUF7_9HYPH|nr:Sec-independent protein translocase protein TatB [Methylobacterium planeticum]KAB1074246.1 twin-arginine translocase subunit TatB [Methylobacterium planeticum]
MLDMSWGEVMLIGGVALIVIGPKDLPKALRTVGQITGKLRRMAGEFQMQFNEAIREAELDEVRREVDGIKRTVSGTPSFNPVQTIRDELKGAVEAREAARPAAPDAQSLADATAQLRAETGQAGTGRAETGQAGGSYDVPRAGPAFPSAADPLAPAASPATAPAPPAPGP